MAYKTAEVAAAKEASDMCRELQAVFNALPDDVEDKLEISQIHTTQTCKTVSFYGSRVSGTVSHSRNPRRNNQIFGSELP